jgi:putative ubiquitin-RnfH superfamily antitoxin RatB of RatAB toxin-antitoxin module
MKVEIIYAKPNTVFHKQIEIVGPATVMHAIEHSRVLQAHPEIDWRVNKVGIYGKVVSDDTILKDNDRIEVYRPLGEVRKRSPVAKTLLTSDLYIDPV